ncbi:MAG: signal transduction histidine kinase [Luteibaculaceae bacterium]|jgi:signal transduction histidine kinase
MLRPISHQETDSSSQGNQSDLDQIRGQLDVQKRVNSAFLDNPKLCSWEWNIGNNVHAFSGSFAFNFGHTGADINHFKDGWKRMVHLEDLGAVDALMQKHILSNGTLPVNTTFRIYHKNGSLVSVQFWAKISQWSEAGKPEIWNGTFLNISEKNGLEKKIEHLEKISLAKNEELQQFAYITSHDLKEPLNIVDSFIGILEEDYSDLLEERGKKSLYYIGEAVNRMRIKIEGLLYLSRIGRTPNFESVDLALIVHNRIEEIQKEDVAKQAIFRVADLPTIEGLPQELETLFLNLLDNALKFNEKNPEIHITCKELTYSWEFAIIDNGIGIHEKNWKKIFKIFNRLHDKGTYSGEGVGLTYCQKIVELHRGGIWIDRNPKGGSQVHFTLEKKR